MSFIKKMCDTIQETTNEITKSTIICGVSFIFWFSKIINRVVDFFIDIYNENDCIKDVVDCTSYYTGYTYNKLTNCKCEPFANTWISSNIVDTKTGTYKFFDTYTILETFDLLRLHSYFVNFLNNKQPSEKNELIILKGYDEDKQHIFYICRQPTNKIHTEYALKYSPIHFLSVNYKNPNQSECVSLALNREWCISGNEILGYTHVLRMLNYQHSPFVFTMDYVLEIIDSDIKVFELHSDEFILFGENGYSVEKINSDSDTDSSEPIEF